MKIEIENYKGFQISYDDYSDKFECEMELNNKVKNLKRGSLNDVRKEVDQFLKANLEFKPFKFFKKSAYGGKSFDTQFCSAIRTDGKFVVGKEGQEKYKSYLTFGEMGLAMVYDANIAKEKARLVKEKEDYITKVELEIEKLFDSLMPCDLSQYKNIVESK